MSYSKKTFVDNQTVIDAATLNAMQDTIIANESGLATANTNIGKLELKTATATWYGLTVKFYKVGRLITAVFDGNITSEVAAANTTNITYPAGFKALTTKYEYKIVAPLRIARVYFSLEYMRVADIVNFSNTASTLASGTGVRFTVSYISAE